MSTGEPKRGRPQATTADTLRDAAFELFQLRGYEHTSVSDIARVAGVSRATFFNYFDAKSDVFWVEVDRALDRCAAALRSTPGDIPWPEAVRDATAHALAGWGPSAVPWVFTQFQLMGQPAAARDSATIRVSRGHALIAGCIAERTGALHLDPHPQIIAGALLGAQIAALLSWARTGPPRPPAARVVTAALQPILRSASSLD